MKYQFRLAAVTLIATSAVAYGGDDPFANTLNFVNETNARIDAYNESNNQNEKEIEFGDYDNDGDLDVLVANGYSDFGRRDNKLYENVGGGFFEEISDSVPLFTTIAGDVARNGFFRDYDGDGWLDMIIVCDNNTSGNGGRTKLWINQQVDGVHSGFTEEGNTRLGSSTGGAACSGVSIDADNDGDYDLYVGNYPGPSQDTQYLNNGAGFFTSVTSTMVPNDGDYTVDVAGGDMNGDGKTDLLVANWSPNYIYYNDNELGSSSGGSGPGDYKYTGSTDNLGVAGQNENAMEPGDFDGDGDMDIYWSNRIGAGDRILENTGNDSAGEANFTTLNILPSSVNVSTRKATVADLNNDGRVDIFVMAESARPTLLRNTTVNGDMSFIEWTPRSAWPSSIHDGWHAAAGDIDNDGDLDIFVGAHVDDHVFVNSDSNELMEADVDRGLPTISNVAPLAILGSAGEGETDTYTGSLSSGTDVSVVLNGPDDYLLEVRNGAGTVIATSNRGGLGIEEVASFTLSGDVSFDVTVIESVGGGGNPADLDDSGMVDAADLAELLSQWGSDGSADLDGSGTVGAGDLAILLGAWGPVTGGDSEYVLEILGRTN